MVVMGYALTWVANGGIKMMAVWFDGFCSHD